MGLLIFVLWWSNAPAALLFYEGFDYPKSEELGETIISNPPWENDKNQFKVELGHLDYPRIQAAKGNRLNVTATSPSLDSVRTAPGVWEAQSSGTLYVSFLLRIESADGIAITGDGTSLLTISKTANNTELLGVNLLNDRGVRLGILKYPSTNTQVSSVFFSTGTGANLSADGSKTYFIVAKYEWVAGAANDTVTLWVDPETLGAAEDPHNQVSTCAGTDGALTAGRLTLSRGPELKIDEIRIGQTWADVTPAVSRLAAAAAPAREIKSDRH